jgi:hypothetical protein
MKQKTTLILAAKRVYISYLALDFFQTKKFDIQYNAHPDTTINQMTSLLSLFDFVQGCIQKRHSDSETIAISIAGKNYDLHIHKTAKIEEIYTVTLSYPLSEVMILDKVPNDYSDEEMSDVLINKPFSVTRVNQEKWTVSLPISEKHNIGGAGKFDLYRTHLVTLFNIIQKLQTEDRVTNLLVALATGSGKTFVQALWLGVLTLPDFNGIFILPDKLITQFRRDLTRLLPDTVTNQMIILQNNASAPQIAAAFHNLRERNTILIASNALLLDNYYGDLLSIPSERSCFIFDEQHLLMANERSRIRLLTLSRLYLSMFLTATPDLETYQMSGNKPVAIMSSGQKQKAKQGQFPRMVTFVSESTSDLLRKKSATTVKEYVKKLVETAILNFDHAIQPDYSSSVLTIFKQLPYIVAHKEQEEEMRWRLQMPMASKMLCIIDDNQTLVNCCNYLQSDTHNQENIYHNGNFVYRGSVAYFFNIPDISETVLAQHQAQQKAEFLAKLTVEEKAILEPILQHGLKYRLCQNMFHYMVEYVLSDLSGRSMIEHNQLRKQSAEAFRQLIQRTYQKRTVDYFYKKLHTELDHAGSGKIADLLSDISQRLGQSFPNFGLYLTDNWFLDDNLLVSMGDNFNAKFSAYAHEHLIMGLMSGMEEAETPVKDSQPFLGLTEERYALYEHAGSQVAHAKRRRRTSIELLDDNARESSFTPNYRAGLTEEIADNYFRLGFIGMYVSNKKTEGFSDANLHTILNATEHTHDLNNSPTNLIQGIGRARGLDDTVLPHYIQGLGHAQTPSFDLKHLVKDDYYPELFQAQSNFEDAYIAILGEQVGADIIAWYHQYQEADETIDPDLLKQQVLYLVARALRALNIQATHKIHISRVNLPKVIAYAMAKLDKEMAHMQHPYELSLLIRVVGSFINFACECYFTVLSFKPWIAIMRHWWTLMQGPTPRATLSDTLRHAEEDRHASFTAEADTIYLKILRQANFKDLVAQGLIAAEFKSWLVHKTNATELVVKKSLLKYLKPEIQAKVLVHLNNCIIPIFEHMVKPSKVAWVREKLQNFDGILSFLDENTAVLQSLQTEMSEAQFAEITLKLLQKVPGLERLRSDDMVNYPQRIKSNIAMFKTLGFTELGRDAQLKTNMAETLTDFLQHDFPQYLGAMVTYPDKQKIIAKLEQNSEQIRTFVEHYLRLCLLDSELLYDVDAIFKEFKICFGLEEIVLLPQKAEQIQQSLTAYQITTVAELIHAELLPCLVNLYPLANRQGLLAQTSVAQIEHLLKTQQADLQRAIAGNKPEVLADFLFSACCKDLPVQIDLAEAKLASEKFFAEQFSGWSGASTGALFLFGQMSKAVTGGTSFGPLNARIAALLKSEKFFEAIAILLPFHHWTVLKTQFHQYPDKVGRLAKQLIQCHEQKTALTPEILLQAINAAFEERVYKSTPDYAREISTQLQGLSTGVTTTCSTVMQQSRLAPIVQVDCLPLLATYIQSDDLKAQFLNYDYAPTQLCDFFVKNFATFKTLAEQESEKQINIVYEFIQQLQPNLLTKKELVDPKTEVTVCKNRVTQKIGTTFAMSNACKNAVTDFFNPQDVQSLHTSLGLKSETETIVRALLTNTDKTEMADVLGSIKAVTPSLQNIQTLAERLQTFQTEMQALQKQGKDVLDNNQLAKTVTVQIQPILKHAKFKTLLQLYMGSLTQKELQFIFSARGDGAAADTAKTLLRFKDLIMKEDFATFQQEFMLCPSGQTYDFEHTPVRKVLNNFAILCEEVITCHGYYQQHDEKGMVTAMPKRPAFFACMSDTTKAIQVPVFDDFMSYFSRKIFFIQGVRNGLPQAGQVFADAHQKARETFQRVKDHILRPLWWTVNSPSFLYHMMVNAQYLLYFLLDLWAQFTQSIKTLLYYLSGIARENSIPQKDDITIDFTKSAFETAKVINDLTPLTSEQVRAQDCPEDVITYVEKAITALPGHRMRLFGRAENVELETERFSVNRFGSAR